LFGTSRYSRRLADRHRQDPLAGLGVARERLDPLQDVVDRGGACQRRVDLLQPFAVEMRVRVDEPGNDGAPAQLDTPGAGMGEREHVGVATDGENAISRDRHRFGDGRTAIEGQDATPLKHEVRRRPRHGVIIANRFFATLLRW
jgi:hypothetical protein